MAILFEGKSPIASENVCSNSLTENGFSNREGMIEFF
jgi:hypothetical protein